MTRKDTILVAVVINAGLLAVLFTTAMIYDPENDLDSNNQTFVEAPKPASFSSERMVAEAEPIVQDEVEEVLSFAAATSPQPFVVKTQSEIIVPEQNTIPFNENKSTPSEDETFKTESTNSEEQNYLEIKVKKGDSLDKIARANGITIEAIKKANDLKSENLKIGQKLKIPVKKEEANTEVREKLEETVYYTVQNGDSPWKIAKKYKINYEDILKLNDMDEEQARNLKIGDKIRIQR